MNVLGEQSVSFLYLAQLEMMVVLLYLKVTFPWFLLYLKFAEK